MTYFIATPEKCIPCAKPYSRHLFPGLRCGCGTSGVLYLRATCLDGTRYARLYCPDCAIGTDWTDKGPGHIAAQWVEFNRWRTRSALYSRRMKGIGKVRASFARRTGAALRTLTSEP